MSEDEEQTANLELIVVSAILSWTRYPGYTQTKQGDALVPALVPNEAMQTAIYGGDT